MKTKEVMPLRKSEPQQELFDLKENSTLLHSASRDDFHAKIYRWLENSRDFMENEVVYFLRLCESLRLPDPIFLSLRTSKDSYHQTVGETLQPFCEGLPTLGFMSVNGRLLIQPMYYPKIESGYTLSDILEEQVDQKYFLSEKAIGQISETGNGKNIAGCLGTRSGSGQANFDRSTTLIMAMRGRGGKQQIEIQKSGDTNSLTSVTKDNLICQK